MIEPCFLLLTCFLTPNSNEWTTLQQHCYHACQQDVNQASQWDMLRLLFINRARNLICTCNRPLTPNFKHESPVQRCSSLLTGFYPSTFLGPVTGPRNSIWDWVLILNLELRINYLCIHNTIKRGFCDFQIFTLSKYSSVVINTVQSVQPLDSTSSEFLTT